MPNDSQDLVSASFHRTPLYTSWKGNNFVIYGSFRKNNNKMGLLIFNVEGTYECSGFLNQLVSKIQAPLWATSNFHKIGHNSGNVLHNQPKCLSIFIMWSGYCIPNIKHLCRALPIIRYLRRIMFSSRSFK